MSITIREALKIAVEHALREAEVELGLRELANRELANYDYTASSVVAEMRQDYFTIDRLAVEAQLKIND